MSKVTAFIHGVYPRSDILSQASRDFDRKRLTASDLENIREKDLSELVKHQKQAGFDFLEDGKLSWQDIFRPIVESTKGMEVGPLTRWFDNNTFYRQPIIKDKLKLDVKKFDKFFSKTIDRKWKATLASPFTFAKLTDDTTTKSFEKTLASVTEIYTELLSYLASKKFLFVQFDEPYIPYHEVKKSEIAMFSKSLSAFKETKGDLVLAVQGYFGDCKSFISTLSESDTVDVLGVDFTKTSLSSLPKKIGKDLILGIVDGRSSLIEEKSVLKNFVEKALKYFGDKTFYLSNNSDLDLLPETVAKEKIKLLGEVGREFSE